MQDQHRGYKILGEAQITPATRGGVAPEPKPMAQSLIINETPFIDLLHHCIHRPA